MDENNMGIEGINSDETMPIDTEAVANAVKTQTDVSEASSDEVMNVPEAETGKAADTTETVESVGASDDSDLVLYEKDGVRNPKKLIKKQLGFDAYTGEAKYEYLVEASVNEETNEPVCVRVMQRGFDAMTGKPVYIDYTENANDNTSDSGENVAEAPKKAFKINWGIAGIIAAIVILLVAAVLLIRGIAGGLGAHSKILNASISTIKGDVFGSQALDALDILSSDAQTYEAEIDMNTDMGRMNLNMDYAFDASKGQMGINGAAKVSGVVEENFSLYYDDSIIQVSLPDLIDDTIFQYDYTSEDNDGYIYDLVRDETEGKLSDVNALLTASNNMYKKSSKYRNALKKELLKVYNNIEIEKTDSDYFEIDDKDRKCVGYSFTIDEDILAGCLDAAENAILETYGDDYSDMISAACRLTGEDEWDEMFEDAREELKDFDDIDVEVYIYKNKLAAVKVETDYEDVSVEFQGGDTRTSNMRIKYSDRWDSYNVKLKSELDGKKLEGSLTSAGVNMLNYTYNTESGKLELSVDGSEMECVIRVKDGSIEMGFDGYLDGYNMEADLNISKKARIKSLEDGDIFDVGTAELEDFTDLFKEMGIAGNSVINELEYLF